MKNVKIAFLLLCLILTACTDKYSNSADNHVEKLPDGYHYVLEGSDIAEMLDYNYEQKNMYLSDVKVFEEFTTSEFGASNEGTVSIDADKGILIFNMTKSTGTISGGIDGPRVYFEMNITLKKIINKTFVPAPDYMALGKPEFAKHSKEVITLNDERMVEIGTFFYEFIEKISQ